MRASRLWVLSAVAVALAACGGGGDDAGAAADSTGAMSSPDSGTTMPVPAPMDSAAGTQAVAGSVTMNAVGNSGITGQADLMAHGVNAAMVTVTLNGQADGAHSGHVHKGTCAAPGEVVVPLQDVTIANGRGTSTSTVSVPINILMSGEHIVAYHAGSGASAGTPVVCGQIPAQQPGAATGTTGSTTDATGHTDSTGHAM
jgi:hypothetical protein